jgi:hypothetical protein
VVFGRVITKQKAAVIMSDVAVVPATAHRCARGVKDWIAKVSASAQPEMLFANLGFSHAAQGA